VNGSRNLHLCYISGLDLRRIDAATTPFLADALARHRPARFANLPSNELFPTMATGVSPVEHGVFGVRLRPALPDDAAASLWRSLPAWLTTTGQCLAHMATGQFDLAAVPPRRRQRFDIKRTKYKRRNGRVEAMSRIGGATTVFDCVGLEHCRYRFSQSYDPVADDLAHVGAGNCRLEVLELYGLDRCQQFNLDQPSAVPAFYGVIDGFLRQLDAKCRAHGVTLVILSDHGHEPIHQTVDLMAILRDAGIETRDLCHFTETSSARLWWDRQDSGVRIREALERHGHATILPWQCMDEVGVPLTDNSYGDLFVVLDPGYAFFPHDFYHPLANLWLGLSDRYQRSRLRHPSHKGNHGHLSDEAVEDAFLCVLKDGWSGQAARGDILDVAPTLLGLLAVPPPASMRGRRLGAERIAAGA